MGLMASHNQSILGLKLITEPRSVGAQCHDRTKASLAWRQSKNQGLLVLKAVIEPELVRPTGSHRLKAHLPKDIYRTKVCRVEGNCREKHIGFEITHRTKSLLCLTETDRQILLWLKTTQTHTPLCMLTTHLRAITKPRPLGPEFNHGTKVYCI